MELRRSFQCIPTRAPLVPAPGPLVQPSSVGGGRRYQTNTLPFTPLALVFRRMRRDRFTVKASREATSPAMTFAPQLHFHLQWASEVSQSFRSLTSRSPCLARPGLVLQDRRETAKVMRGEPDAPGLRPRDSSRGSTLESTWSRAHRIVRSFTTWMRRESCLAFELVRRVIAETTCSSTISTSVASPLAETRLARRRYPGHPESAPSQDPRVLLRSRSEEISVFTQQTTRRLLAQRRVLTSREESTRVAVRRRLRLAAGRQEVRNGRRDAQVASSAATGSRIHGPPPTERQESRRLVRAARVELRYPKREPTAPEPTVNSAAQARAKQQPVPPALDLARLSEDVMGRIERRLRVERQRRGAL